MWKWRITNYDNLLLQFTIAWLLQFSTTVITIYDDCYYNLQRVLQFNTLLQFTTVHVLIVHNWLPFPIGQVCSQVWCWPYLVTNFGIYELRKFPWSPSKVEVGTFYPFTPKVGSKYTWIILESSSVKLTNITKFTSGVDLFLSCGSFQHAER